MAVFSILTRPRRARVDVVLDGRRTVISPQPAARRRLPAREVEIAVKRQSGSIVIEQEVSGNLILYTDHTPSNRVLIENADVDDLTIALDAIMQERRSTPGDLKPVPAKQHGPYRRNNPRLPKWRRQQ